MSMYSVIQHVRELDTGSGEVIETTSVVKQTEDLRAAFVKLDEIKAYFWNEPNVYAATAKVMDENLIEFKEPDKITHPEPEPEPGPEPEES